MFSNVFFKRANIYFHLYIFVASLNLIYTVIAVYEHIFIRPLKRVICLLVNSVLLHHVCAYHVCTVDEWFPGPLLGVV